MFVFAMAGGSPSTGLELRDAVQRSGVWLRLSTLSRLTFRAIHSLLGSKGLIYLASGILWTSFSFSASNGLLMFIRLT